MFVKSHGHLFFYNMKYTEFDIKLNQNNVFTLIDCFQDSPIYDEVLEEYEKMLDNALSMIEPAAVLEFGSIPACVATDYLPEGTEALFAITTVGDKISAWSTALFEEGNYLAGMLADAMADDYLFQASESLKPILQKLCEDRRLGITTRMEAPSGIPMEIQKVALETADPTEELGIKITSSYMYDPVKTTCQVYLVKKDYKEYHMDHDCRNCPNKSCKSRNPSTITIEVEINSENVHENHRIQSTEECSVLEMLRKENLYVPAICAGRGTCGKCRMQVLEGQIDVSSADEKMFSAKQLDDGFRLACTAYPKGDIKICFQDSMEDEMEILGGEEAAENKNFKETDESEQQGKFVLGIDIGTTTIAMSLVNAEIGTVKDSYLTINRQRKFGADVISRMQASTEGKKEELQSCICEDLYIGIEKLTHSGTLLPEKIVIAGNTTMVHLLMAYPCETLGVYPFTPYHIEKIESTLGEIFAGCNPEEKLQQIPIYILPGISTFVGADIVADMLVCNMAEQEQVTMLIDLGTNGEMALGNRDKILVTSTAAGPAFEGGNITHGTGSIPGAIYAATIENREAKVCTIQDKPATGICGTGVISIMHELLKAELVDETGLLDEDYEEDGFLLAHDKNGEAISFFQKDIRELQLAKSAVRAGLETLILRYGITADEVNQVYLAGGFGYNVDVQKAIGIGLLPENFQDKIQVIGNGSLKGSVLFAREQKEQRITKIVNISEEIGLSADKDFNELYMEHMYFE